MTAETEPRLRFVHVFAIGAGAMFSSGFFLLPGIAADETGASLPLAYLLAGILVLPTILCVTELAVAMPRAGGPYHFYRRSLGPTVATVGGIGLWVALVLKASFALVGIDAYLSILLDLPDGLVGLGLAVVFTVLNIAGARESAVVQVWLVAVLVLVLSVFVATGTVTAVGIDDARLTERFSPLFEGGALGLLAATAIVFVAFAGLPQVASVAGSIEEPSRTIPRGVLAALAVATTIYVTGTAVLVWLLPAAELHDDRTPIATAAEEFGIGPAVPLVVVAALAAFASTGNAGIMSASRYPLALASDGVVWRRFARLNDKGVPVVSVILTGVVIAVVVTFVDVEGIATLGSTFVLISFGLMNAAVIVLRRARVPGYRPSFRVPLVPWLPGFGVLTSIVLVIDLGLMPLVAALVVVAGGTAWHAWARRGADDELGALAWYRRHRGWHFGEEDLTRLQETGPRADDRAPDVLAAALVRRVAAEAGLAEIRRAAADALADAVQVSEQAASHWLGDDRHPVVTIDGEHELHVIGIDGPGDPVVAIAWAGDDAGPGTTVAVVAAPDLGSGRPERIAALVATQIDDDSVRDDWPADPADVPEHLATDAAQRQGADEPPST